MKTKKGSKKADNATKIDGTKFVPRSSDAMTVLAAETSHKKQFFSRDRAKKALVDVIKEAGNNYMRAGVAAALAVHFADELKIARKENARRGYQYLLEDLVAECKARVFRYDPTANVIARNFPKIASWFSTPDMVLDAEAFVEVVERTERRRNPPVEKADKPARRAA